MTDASLSFKNDELSFYCEMAENQTVTLEDIQLASQQLSSKDGRANSLATNASLIVLGIAVVTQDQSLY